MNNHEFFVKQLYFVLKGFQNYVNTVKSFSITENTDNDLVDKSIEETQKHLLLPVLSFFEANGATAEEVSVVLLQLLEITGGLIEDSESGRETARLTNKIFHKTGGSA